MLLNTLDTTVSIQRGKKLGYALRMRTDYEETQNLKRHSVKDCPYHANKDKTLKRINELKPIHKLFSMKSETDDGLSIVNTSRAGLKCKPSKCEILRDSIKYLGRMVDSHGVRPDPEAVEAVLTWKAPRTDTQLLSFLGFDNYYREFIKGYADKVYPMQKLMRNKGKKFEWNDEEQIAFENIKRELCEVPVLGMPREKGMYVLDTDASVVAISGILHQEKKWIGRTVLHHIAYGSKVFHTEMKYGAPKAEMFAVVTFVGKYRAYLGSAPFKLRVDNRALSWLKTNSMDQSYIGRWIVRLDGYHIIIEHRMRDKHQNADKAVSWHHDLTNSVQSGEETPFRTDFCR